jgi:exosome complex component RRP41
MEARLHIEKLAEITELATEGCMQIYNTLDATIRKNTQHLMSRLNA